MTLDISMGGSTNTVLHLLAASHEGEVGFTMDDIDRLSRKVPVLCKVAPAREHPHGRRAPRRRHHGILGELDRAGLIDSSLPTIHSATMKEALAAGTSSRPTPRPCTNSIPRPPAGSDTDRFLPGAPLRGRRRSRPQDRRHPRKGARLFPGRRTGRAVRQHREDGCIVKTAGVDESILKFTGPARIFESQDRCLRDPDRQGQAGRGGPDPL
jgi:dihydroxy-acid dehydratase